MKLTSLTTEQLATNQIAVLGFLMDGPRHGYAMYRELASSSDLWLVWRMKQSQFYALLVKLEANGMLTSFKDEQEAGRPPRKMYQLTPAGRNTFESWITTPVTRGRQFRLDLLVKLFFAQKRGHDHVDTLLTAQQASCSQWLDASCDAAQDKAPYRRLVHQYRVGQIEAMLVWIDACRKELITAPRLNTPAQ